MRRQENITTDRTRLSVVVNSISYRDASELAGRKRADLSRFVQDALDAHIERKKRDLSARTG